MTEFQQEEIAGWMTPATAAALDAVPEAWLSAHFPDFGYTEAEALRAIAEYTGGAPVN